MSAAAVEIHFEAAAGRVHASPRLMRGETLAHRPPLADFAASFSEYDAMQRPA